MATNRRVLRPRRASSAGHDTAGCPLPMRVIALRPEGSAGSSTARRHSLANGFWRWTGGGPPPGPYREWAAPGGPSFAPPPPSPCAGSVGPSLAGAAFPESEASLPPAHPGAANEQAEPTRPIWQPRFVLSMERAPEEVEVGLVESLNEFFRTYVEAKRSTPPPADRRGGVRREVCGSRSADGWDRGNGRGRDRRCRMRSGGGGAGLEGEPVLRLIG